jgi:hypothetical protein
LILGLVYPAQSFADQMRQDDGRYPASSRKRFRDTRLRGMLLQHSSVLCRTFEGFEETYVIDNPFAAGSDL